MMPKVCLSACCCVIPKVIESTASGGTLSDPPSPSPTGCEKESHVPALNFAHTATGLNTLVRKISGNNARQDVFGVFEVEQGGHVKMTCQEMRMGEFASCVDALEVSKTITENDSQDHRILKASMSSRKQDYDIGLRLDAQGTLTDYTHFLLVDQSHHGLDCPTDHILEAILPFMPTMSLLAL